MNTLAAEEWLQYVLMPRLREVARGESPLPTESSGSAWATRQFDGDPDADALVALLRDLDALVDGELLEAVAAGDQVRVEELLARGTHGHSVGDDGIPALHVAAAAGHPALATLIATPLAVHLAALGRDHAPTAMFAPIATALLAAGAQQDGRVGPAQLTPLMVASYFGQREVVDVLRAAGADPELRDALGRTAERLAVFPTIHRVIGLCRTLPMVSRAYVAQLHAPATHQFTTPVLGLELSAALPADAFASWPASDPIVAFVLADDAVSRLVRLTPPIYIATSGLVVGARYRVREAIQELIAGEVVTYAGVDDIDNHFGRHEFVTEDARTCRVSGDLSSTRSDPLGEVARYLERLP